MFIFNIIIFTCLFSILQLFVPENGFAWGPGIHAAVALNSLDNVRLMLPPIGELILAFPREYFYGCLAADFFIGKSWKKKGNHPHNWEGGFAFLKESSNDQEKAFSYGFLAHLAADVIAHNFFIPSLLSVNPIRRGHLYWEIRADHWIGLSYLKMAQEILKMDHQECDDLLKVISGNKKINIKAKKQIFTQSVKFSNYFSLTHNFVFFGNAAGWKVINKYMKYMIDISCLTVNNFLMDPTSSPCLSYDPMGLKKIRLAKHKRLLNRPLLKNHLIGGFAIDKEFLEL